jgi:hypothetical protein
MKQSIVLPTKYPVTSIFYLYMFLYCLFQQSCLLMLYIDLFRMFQPNCYYNMSFLFLDK